MSKKKSSKKSFSFKEIVNKVPFMGKNKKKTKKKIDKKSRKRTIILSSITTIIAIPVVFMLAFVATYAFTTVPEPTQMSLNQVTTLKYKDGSEMIRVIPPEGNRTIVKLEDVPENVKYAIIAAEDRTFETNPGFSVNGLLRALRDNLIGSSSAGGGSTITQQYVKNSLVGNKRSYSRKWKELVTATKMSKEWSKDEILEAYLNTVYFGRLSYGIASASRAYFGKSYKQLTTEEAAVLAATLQAPTLMDPANNLEAAKGRWDYVMDGLVEINHLSKAERSKMQYPKVKSPRENSSTDDIRAKGPLGLVRTRVLNELSGLGIDEADINTKGLKITTTIDKKTQTASKEVTKDVLASQPGDLRASSVSIDPKTGGVRGYYGGSDGYALDYAQSGLQTGSTFKVFALIAALDQNIPLSKRYSSAPLTLGNVTINNSDGMSCGVCSISLATKMSLNTSFYRLMLDLNNGAQDVADYAHKAGVAESFGNIQHTLAGPNNTRPENGIVLGQYQSRVIDMASSYATLAASGIFREPYFIEKVETSQGEVLYSHKRDAGKRVLKAAVADNTTAALEPVAAYSNGHVLAGGRVSASKTGTAQYGDSGENKDAWMIGYTPSLSTAVWVGTANGTAIRNSYGGIIYGSGIPSDIWKGIMDAGLEGTPYETFPRPAAIAGQSGRPIEYVEKKKEKKKEKKEKTPQKTESKKEDDFEEDSDYSKDDDKDIEILPGIKIPDIFAPNRRR